MCVQLYLRALTAPLDSASVFVSYYSADHFRLMVPQAPSKTMNKRNLLILQPVAQDEQLGGTGEASDHRYVIALRLDADPGQLAADHCLVRIEGQRTAKVLPLAPVRLAAAGHPDGLLFPSVLQLGGVSAHSTLRARWTR